MTIEQILLLALQGAAEQAPPAPDADWFRAQATDNVEDATPDVPTGLPLKDWQELADSPPILMNPAYHIQQLHVGHADTREIIAEPPTPVLGTIPARVVRGDTVIKAEVQATSEPAVAKDGSLLILRIRVPESGFRAGESVELTIRTLPEDRLPQGRPLGSLWLLRPGRETRLDVALPPELHESWRGRDWKWEELPFRFILRPSSDTTDDDVGEATSHRR